MYEPEMGIRVTDLDSSRYFDDFWLDLTKNNATAEFLTGNAPAQSVFCFFPDFLCIYFERTAGEGERVRGGIGYKI